MLQCDKKGSCGGGGGGEGCVGGGGGGCVGPTVTVRDSSRVI